MDSGCQKKSGGWRSSEADIWQTVFWIILHPLPWWPWDASGLKLVVVSLRFSLPLCFSSQFFALVAFLEEEKLGLGGLEQTLESMEKHGNPSASIPISGTREKMKMLRHELMNTPREVRTRTLIACTAVQRVWAIKKKVGTTNLWVQILSGEHDLKLGEKIHVPGILKSIVVTYLERIEWAKKVQEGQSVS